MTRHQSKNITTKWFVLMGFNKNDEDHTGFLSFDIDEKVSYKIVDNVKDALKFPEKNITSKKGFGTPKQWLKFFNSEPMLNEWKFHLMQIKHN